MPKFKELFPSIFGLKSSSPSASGNDNVKGRLETDALPVDDGINGNQAVSINTEINTPTASEEFNNAVVQRLSEPNYNSLESIRRPSDTSLVPIASGALVTPDAMGTYNTMNVNNTQGQVVMQFSNMSQVHFGSVYNINNNKANAEKGAIPEQANTFSFIEGASKPRQQRRTTTIAAMMQCQDSLNHRLLDTISAHLGEGWKDVMRAIGASDGQIEQAIIDHQMHGGIKEVIYQLLLQWIRNADDGEATVARITNLLWESNHRDCVQRMKLVWKSDNVQK